MERFWRDARGRLTCDIPDVTAEDYMAACNAIMGAFALTADSLPVLGLEQMFWDFRREGQIIGMDWDIWSGFMVVAKTEEAEALVREIAEWFESGGFLQATFGD